MTRTARRWPLGIALLCCAGTGCGSGPETLDGPGQQAVVEDILFVEDADPATASLPFVADELLVQPLPGADSSDLADLYGAVGAVVIGQLQEIEFTVLQVPPEEFLDSATRLADSGLIETVQKNYLLHVSKLPNDPLFARQDHLAQIGAAQAWDTTVGVEEIIIAVVDTGVDPDHPDLSARIVDGWNVFSGNADFSDVVGHGTMVAGVVAALSDNALGVAGLTWKNPLLAIRVTNGSGDASSKDVAAGILWAMQRGARIINVSFAPLWSNRVVQAAAREAFNRGSLVVISAGNDGAVTEGRGYREALFVGGVDRLDRVARFSTRGPFVDLVAPAVNIRSTERGGGFGIISGTSFAAPIVSGVAALAWSVNPDLRPVTLQEIVLQSTVDLGEVGKDGTYGEGAVDAAATVDRASSATRVRDVTPPSLSIDRPSNGATLVGRSVARVRATDRWGVADVVMSVDGIPVATDSREPYRFVIDPNRFTSGRHELSFVATDRSGLVSPRRTVSVTFQARTSGASGSASTITFRSPRAGAAVSGNVSIEAVVSDPDGLATVEWFVDGESVLVSSASGRSMGVSFLWRTGSASAGRHTVSLVVTDAKGGRAVGRLELILR